MQIKNSLYILITAALTLSACTNHQKARNSTHTAMSKDADAAQASAEGNVAYLSTADFRLKIMDYEAHQTEWVFDG